MRIDFTARQRTLALNIGLIVVALGLVVALKATSVRQAQADPEDKVTICHAAGQDGTTKFVEITASRNAIFGQAGHFYENGTPRAGHEQDYLGPCNRPSPSPSPSASPSPSPSPR